MEVCTLVKYITKTNHLYVLSLFLIITATFFLMEWHLVGPFASEKKLPPEIEAN